MPDSNSKYSLSDLSARFNVELRGDGDQMIDGVGTLDTAGPTRVTFLANPSYRKQLPETQAGAVILKERDASVCPTNCLVAGDPYLAYARLAALFDPRPAVAPGIHPTAVISPTAKIGKDVSIAAHVVIADNCEVGDGVVDAKHDDAYCSQNRRPALRSSRASASRAAFAAA